MLEGEMRFELEGESERVIRAGEAFWEPGGDFIHYQDGNNRPDVWTRFAVVMIGTPGVPRLALGYEAELVCRREPPRPAWQSAPLDAFASASTALGGRQSRSSLHSIRPVE